jgi:hypothetical protein
VGWVSKKFDLKIDRSTVSKILKNSESILESTKSRAMRSKVVKFPELEEMLREWFLKSEKTTIISDAMIVEKGKEIPKSLNMSEGSLNFSNGWLHSFKTRNKIKQIKTHGESGSVNTEDIEKYFPELVSLIANYDAKDIYNFDETALFFRMEPDRTLDSKLIEEKKEKQRKDNN